MSCVYVVMSTRRLVSLHQPLQRILVSRYLRTALDNSMCHDVNYSCCRVNRALIAPEEKLENKEPREFFLDYSDRQFRVKLPTRFLKREGIWLASFTS